MPRTADITRAYDHRAALRQAATALAAAAKALDAASFDHDALADEPGPHPADAVADAAAVVDRCIHAYGLWLGTHDREAA